MVPHSDVQHYPDWGLVLLMPQKISKQVYGLDLLDNSGGEWYGAGAAMKSSRWAIHYISSFQMSSTSSLGYTLSSSHGLKL